MSEFYRPSYKSEALELLSRHGKDLLIVNGGTDAVLSIVEGKVQPKVIMQVSQLPDFHRIWNEGGYLHIGGGATFNEMMASADAGSFCGLMEALGHLASPSIRVLGTAAGNICTAAPAADCAAMLYALQAEVVLESVRGARVVPLADYYDTSSSYMTVMEADELVTEIRVPALEKGEGTGYCRLSRRKAQDIAKVIIGVRLTLDKGVISSCSVALGALNATLVHGTETEKAVIGMSPDKAIEYVRNNWPVEAKLHKSYFTEYKKSVVCGAVGRAFEKALENAGGNV